MIEAYARGFVLLALFALAGCHITKQHTICGPDPFVVGDIVTHAITNKSAVVLASFCTGSISGRTRAYSVSDGGGEFIAWYAVEIVNNNTRVDNQ
jgi:hypothetical protein